MTLGRTSWFASILCTLAGTNAPAPQVLSGREYLSVVRGEGVQALADGDDFELKQSGRSVLLATHGHILALDSGRPAGGEEWRGGKCLVLDHGPEKPGAILSAPRDSADLPIAGRRFSKSGPVWLGYLFATNGTYLALFSTSARRLHRPDQTSSWAGEPGTLESQGEVFIDLYRVGDARRLATAKYAFSGTPGIERAFWLDSRVLVVPTVGAAVVGTLDALPAQTLPFAATPGSRNGFGWSCSNPPPPPRILGLRDEGVDEDHNGLLEGVRVIAAIEVALPGPYSFTFQLDNGRGGVLKAEGRQDLVAGTQEIAAFFPGNEWQTGGESNRLAAIQFTAARPGAEQPVAVAPARELRTGAWARSRFEPPGSRYLPDTVKVTSIDYNHDGLYEGLEVEVVLYSEWEGQLGLCPLGAYLSNDPTGHGFFDMAHWSGDLRRGRNPITFSFDPHQFVGRLLPQPFYLASAQTECEASPFSGPTGLPIKLPPIDFSRFKDAHCSFDWNNDGVVDEADLKLMLDRAGAAGPVDAARERIIRDLYESYRGCRTK